MWALGFGTTDGGHGGGTRGHDTVVRAIVGDGVVPAAVVTRDIHKHYGRTRAVDGVSIEIESGEFYGFLGPNGAGKTTTLEIIEGLRKPDSGEVSVLGLPPWP